MEITFKDKKLKKLCEQHTKATTTLGADGAKKLRTRLADLLAAESVQDLVAGHPHPLKGDRYGQFSVNLSKGKRLVFISANEPIPQKEDESIDWAQVTKVCIVFIGDYHD
ncbi:MAG: type II toxin-antitoxin system RelE/ParE family toxin [Cyanobacteria bacterium P01_E01_bin.42]